MCEFMWSIVEFLGIFIIIVCLLMVLLLLMAMTLTAIGFDVEKLVKRIQK